MHCQERHRQTLGGTIIDTLNDIPEIHREVTKVFVELIKDLSIENKMAQYLQ